MHAGRMPQAARRALAVLCLWLAAGRAGETAWLSFEGISWDAFFKCPFVEVAQSKPSKLKLVPFMAGANSLICFFAHLGIFLAVHGVRSYDDCAPPFLFPVQELVNRHL